MNRSDCKQNQKISCERFVKLIVLPVLRNAMTQSTEENWAHYFIQFNSIVFHVNVDGKRMIDACWSIGQRYNVWIILSPFFPLGQ